MANNTRSTAPDPILISVLLPTGSPPYETPLDLRCPLHFATGKQYLWPDAQNIGCALDKISGRLRRSSTYECYIRLVNSHIATHSSQKTPWYFCVEVAVQPRLAETVEQLVDFRSIYENSVRMIREEFTDSERMVYEFLRKPIVRFRIEYYQEDAVLN